MFHQRLLVAAAALLTVSLPSQTIYPTGTTIWSKDKTWDGFTLFNGPDGVVYLVDMAGNTVHTWKSPLAGQNFALAEPLDTGHILVTLRPPNSMESHTVVELDWDGRVIWAFTLLPVIGYIHHEIERLPNGNTLLLCAQRISVPSISPIKLIDDFILEVDAGGNPVWTWYTWQHFNEFGFDAQALSLIAAKGDDWAHANAVHSLPPNRHAAPALRPGNLVVSQRSTNIVFIIDRTSGNIVWKIGPNNPMTQAQHAPYMIEAGKPGAGNILVFDNGAGTGYPLQGFARGFSRILEIDPATQQTMWDYDAGRAGVFSRLFYADIVSNAQRLPNGNTLICSGVNGRLFEVTSTWELVWEYMSPVIGSIRGQQGPLIYRAYRVGPSWPLVKPVF